MATKSEIEIWKALSEHFLDNDCRFSLPHSAMILIEHKVDIKTARSIWRYEVTPALFSNLFSIAGIWSGFKDEWLVKQIAECRTYKIMRIPGLNFFIYSLLNLPNLHTWKTIEQIMEFLSTAKSIKEQRSIANELEGKFRYFVFDDPIPAEHADSDMISSESFVRLFKPVLSRKELKALKLKIKLHQKVHRMIKQVGKDPNP